MGILPLDLFMGYEVTRPTGYRSSTRINFWCYGLEGMDQPVLVKYLACSLENGRGDQGTGYDIRI